MPQSWLSTPSWLSLRATCQVQNPATSLVGADITAAALPTPNGRKRPFAGQAARALQVHAETFKRTHGHVTSLLEAPLGTAPGQPVPHHRQWWVLGWPIRRVAVSRDATVRHPGLGSLPSSWFVPDNCCICTTIGSGCVSLGGGDYDGDLLMFTSNPILLKFLDCTPSGTEVPEFNAARAHVEGLVEKSSPTRLRSIMQYREHCLHVPPPQIRGLLTALAERAQQQVFDASDPERDAALIHCVRLAVAAEKAITTRPKRWTPNP